MARAAIEFGNMGRERDGQREKPPQVTHVI